MKNNPISIRLKDEAKIALEKKISETKQTQSEIINNLLIGSNKYGNGNMNRRPIVQSICEIEFLVSQLYENNEIKKAILKEVDNLCRALK